MSWVQSKFTDFAPPCKKLKIDNSNDNSAVGKSGRGVSYLDQKPLWKPRTKHDLVVNRKKIEDIESWLIYCKTRTEPSIMLLTGPSGCGKLSTLKVLCYELKINLVEWLPQIAQRKYDPEGGEFYQSMSSLFEEFIVRATRYTNVLNAMSSRIVVIKDIPNCYIRDSATFHEVLGKYSRVHNVHLVFILTEGSLVRSLFPDHVKTSFNVTSVSFNPVTQRGVKDVLKKLFPDRLHSFIDTVSASCDGDLRKAITTFQFASRHGALPPPKKPKSVASKSSDKSDFLDIFHGLGRILYSKRENGKLVHDPVTVGESFVTSPDLFLGMLHENYLHTFASIHDIAKAAESLSTAGILLTDDYKDTLSSRSLSLAVASSGVMIHNSAPVKKFQQMNKSRKVVNTASEFRSRFSDSSVFLDVATYGRAIPSYAQENSEWLSRINELK